MTRFAAVQKRHQDLRVEEVGDGIARIYGLENVMSGELIQFKGGVSGIALNLEEEDVGAVLLGEYSNIKEGDEVRRTGRIMSIPVGEGMIGRVVDALGLPIDGKGPIEAKAFNHIERIAPGVVELAHHANRARAIGRADVGEVFVGHLAHLVIEVELLERLEQRLLLALELLARRGPERCAQRKGQCDPDEGDREEKKKQRHGYTSISMIFWMEYEPNVTRTAAISRSA